MDLRAITTETRNRNTLELDEMSAIEIVTVMNKEDAMIPLAIRSELPQIAAVVDAVAQAFENGHRLFYTGAGTSGRLGVLDASECPPTFGVDKNMVIGLIAGGDYALRNAVEKAEDSKEMGVDDLKAHNLSKGDVVVGIAASGRTPYVIGGLEYANELGCVTGCICCNKGSEIGKVAQIKIEAEPGPEVLTGSTRLKSGTTQKLICNMITTAAMVRTGKAYQNLMVDVMQSNDKLVVRAENIVIDATGVDRDVARAKIDEAQGNCKTAILMILADCSFEEATQRLDAAKGHVKAALGK